MSVNIKYGASTWLWTSPFQTSSVEELFSKISALGFDAVEIAVEDPSLVDVETVCLALQKYKLKAVVCGAFSASRDLTSEDPDVQQNCFKYIETCLDLCVSWGVSIFAGPMYSAVGKARMVPPEQREKEWQLAVVNLRIAAEMAESRGVRLAIEPLNRFESDLVNTAEDVVRLVKDINHPSAGILLDGFHMAIEERNIETAIKLAGDRLLHLQVSENYRGSPGTGQTPWDSYKAGLEAINYQGIVSIESFTPANQDLAAAVCIWRPFADSQDDFAREGLEFLKSHFNK
ncbi:sugar phosphate isomerase/epimerase family protein [Pedobacter kyonggii]|uniref:Sugar phosphate isomerase/epimerase n=1 Tax=Pedobacter kyonggii TaxID=1926871 RepID=A0A4Q9H979_9SPHI|nr:sugar phosphate isomerase/epimerase family protein [Pedobacter kyonggii]TBO40441.1 sugar phosphate isomerase/epimerase [Pedobacter kyonggii]